MKTVEEVALEYKNGVLEEQLAALKGGGEISSEVLMSPPGREIGLRESSPRILVPRTSWSVERYPFEQLQCIGRIFEDKSTFELTHYVETEILLDLQWGLNSLGNLHKRMVDILAREWLKVEG